MELKIRNKLYRLAMWYIGKCNAKWNKPNKNIQSLDRLTYRNNEKAYLRYGADAEWQHFSRYDVLDNAIQKLAKYEDAEANIPTENSTPNGVKPMRYAVQRLRNDDYVPSIGRQLHPMPEIRYYDADSEKDAREMNLKENGFDWQYIIIKPAFEPGDYIGNCDDICYLIEEINDKMMIIYNPITNTKSTEYVDYVKWHLLSKKSS